MNTEIHDPQERTSGKVELTITIEGRQEQFRVEAIEGPEGVFSTRTYIKRAYSLSPADPEGAQAELVELWTPYDLPETHRDKANDAIDQALSFLNERVRGS